MTDLLSEELAPLSRATRWVPSIREGTGVNPSTIWRWINRGVRGIRLEHLEIGGVTMTSREALSRFFAHLTNGDAAPPPRSAALEREHARAKKELAEIGI